MGRGLAKAETSKRKQRKWVRYERKQSMSAGHIDWHEDPVSGLKTCAILDASSRKILAIDEFATIDTEHSIAIVERVILEFGEICPLHELIMDHGSEFGTHRIDENGNWDSEFKRFLEFQGIRPIPARLNIPRQMVKSRNGSIPIAGSGMSLILSMILSAGTMTDLTAAGIS